MFVYICIIIWEPIVRGEGWNHINWFNPPHFCVCRKPGSEFPTSSNVVVFFMFNEKWQSSKWKFEFTGLNEILEFILIKFYIKTENFTGPNKDLLVLTRRISDHCEDWGDCSFCWYWWNCWPSLFKLCLSFCTFSFGHYVVCSSSIYGFWLPLWYLQTLLPISYDKSVTTKHIPLTLFDEDNNRWSSGKIVFKISIAISACSLKYVILLIIPKDKDNWNYQWFVHFPFDLHMQCYLLWSNSRDINIISLFSNMTS